MSSSAEYVSNQQEQQERMLLQKEIVADQKNDGPMKTITDTLQTLLQTERLKKISLESLSTPCVVKNEFSFHGKKFELALIVYKSQNETKIRVSILEPQSQRQQIQTQNSELQLLKDELTFGEYTLEQYQDATYVSGNMSSSPQAEKGFAKSLVLNTHTITRHFMRIFNIPRIEASIGDASEAHWSRAMAQRLGFSQSPDFEDLSLYTYTQ